MAEYAPILSKDPSKASSEKYRERIRVLPALYRSPGDRAFKNILVVLSSSIILLAVGMGIALFLDSMPTLEVFGFWGFLTGTQWDPVAGQHGACPFILGTLITSLGALAISILPAIAVAIFVSEYAPKGLATVINYTIDLLAAIPSVVIGLWAIFNFAPVVRDALLFPIFNWAEANASWLLPIIGEKGPAPYNMISATIILALMIIPYTVALSRDAIGLVPREQREAAWALGATKWEVIRMAILPYAKGGIFAGALLSLARALGETMAVAMLIGNSNKLPFTLFGPAATMPSVIINEFREAVEPLHLSSLMAVGFYLFLITIVMNVLAILIQRQLVKGRTV